MKYFSEIDEVETIFSNFTNDVNIINVDECKPNSLVVFDDCILESQKKIKRILYNLVIKIFLVFV